MPKNLVFIHLESISNTILWQYRAELKTIWWMMQQSFFYNRFYTSATSTVMSLQHIWNGASDIYDSVSTFGQMHERAHPSQKAYYIDYTGAPGVNTIPYLAALAGYDVPDRVTFVHEFQTTERVEKERNIVKGPDHDALLPVISAALAQKVHDGVPFTFFYVPGITHVTCEDRVKNAATSFSDRFRLGYIRLDEQVKNVLGLLHAYKLMDNTIIVFYGDHGDELWSHGLIGGWCHVTTPYASLCWTPLFIYDSDCAPGSSDQVVSSIDLKETLLKRLVPGFEPEKRTFSENWKNYAPEWNGCRTLEHPVPFKRSPFCGVDAGKETRKYAFSQSLFALQLEYNDPVESLVKGYAVTDGIYRLCVTSGGREPRDGGLEFFCDRVDPTNHRNLLSFFQLDSNGDIVKFYPPPSVNSRDFDLMFNPEAIEYLRETYQEMKAALYDYVRSKEEQAIPHSVGKYHVMSDSAFKHMRKRPYKD